MTTKLERCWTIQVCPECNGQCHGLAYVHSGDCPNRTRGFVAEEVVVEEVLGCTCPVGFGQVRDPRCPRHGNRAPEHTIDGA